MVELRRTIRMEYLWQEPQIQKRKRSRREVTTIFRRSWIRMTEQIGLRRIVRRMFFLILQRTHLEMEPVMGKTPK